MQDNDYSIEQDDLEEDDAEDTLVNDDDEELFQLSPELADLSARVELRERIVAKRQELLDRVEALAEEENDLNQREEDLEL